MPLKMVTLTELTEHAISSRRAPLFSDIPEVCGVHAQGTGFVCTEPPLSVCAAGRKVRTCLAFHSLTITVSGTLVIVLTVYNYKGVGGRGGGGKDM